MDKVIDIECLKSDGIFIVKEIAIISTTEPELFTTTFQPPYLVQHLLYGDQRQNAWITKHLTHICWDDGEEPYENLVPFIKSCTSVGDCLYTKGTEKATFLTTLLNQDVYELGELGCPRPERLMSSDHVFQCCHFNHNHRHRLSSHCAIKKCHVLVEWMRNHLPFV